MEILRCEAQTYQHLFHIRLDVGCSKVLAAVVQVGEGFYDPAVAFRTVILPDGNLVVQPFNLTVNFVYLLKGFKGLLPDAFAALDFQLLRQVSGAEPFGDDHVATLRFQFVGENAQQRGLSGAVLPDQTDPLVVPDDKMYILENRNARKIDGQVIRTNHSYSMPAKCFMNCIRM